MVRGRKVFSFKQRPEGANGRKTRKTGEFGSKPPENKLFKRHANFDETLRRQSFLTWGEAPLQGFESTKQALTKLDQKLVIPLQGSSSKDFKIKSAVESLNSPSKDSFTRVLFTRAPKER